MSQRPDEDDDIEAEELDLCHQVIHNTTAGLVYQGVSFEAIKQAIMSELKELLIQEAFDQQLLSIETEEINKRGLVSLIEDLKVSIAESLDRILIDAPTILASCIEANAMEEELSEGRALSSALAVSSRCDADLESNKPLVVTPTTKRKLH